MNLIVCIKRGSDRNTFIADATAAGITLSPIEGLPRQFTAEWPDLNSFPLRLHPSVFSVDDGDQESNGAMQSITISDSLLQGGSWCIARTIRRSAPWNVDRIKTPYDTFYTAERDGTGVDVYILDSGIDTGHPCFGSRATNVYEFYSSGGLGDDVGHGTLVASAGVGDEVGYARGSLLWSFKMTTGAAGSPGTGTNTSMSTAIGQLLTHYSGRSGTNRPAVCILSQVNYSGASIAAIGDMIDVGIVPVICAGNDMADLATLTGTINGGVADAIVVAGTNMADQAYYRSDFGTNYGTRVDVLAGAYLVWTARAFAINSSRGYFAPDGTSLAAPQVAGVVACMLQGKSRLTTRTQVQAVRAKVIANATTGKFRAQPQWTQIGTLPDRILYLDPTIASETISGVP